jgi:PAS domain S-box-containing protein
VGIRRYSTQEANPFEQRRFAALALAATLVASAFLLQRILGLPADQPHFWLFHLAIALTAAFGGAAATLVATLLGLLLVRLSSPVPLSAALLSALEGLLVGLVVLRMAQVIQNVRQRLDASATSIRELESAKRQGIRTDRALSRLERESEDTVLIFLDQSGHISEWRAGATRLYGFESSQMVGTAVAILFDEPGRADFPRLIADARGAASRRRCRQVRAGGTAFEAEIEICSFSQDGLNGFTMIVRDLTRQHARAATDWSTAQAQAELRGEMELAQRQLLTLQEVTDPTLNSLDTVQFVSELLERLRSAVHAEGIALIDVGSQPPRQLFCASAGLQCQLAHHRPAAPTVATDPARAVMIHNDRAGVAEMSAAVWPDDVSSLIAVPVVRAGSTMAVMEVVNRTGRRATEFEIALVQVVSARIAGFLHDEADTSRTLSGSDLRLTLDQSVSDHPGRDRIAS